MKMQFPPDAYDEQLKLKPSIGMLLVMLYSIRHVFLIFLAYFPLMRGGGDSTFIKEFMSLQVMAADLPAILLLVTLVMRQPGAHQLWRSIWQHGRLILILTLAIQLIVDILQSGMQIIDRSNQEMVIPVLLYLLLDLYVMLYAVRSNRIRMTFLDFPDEKSHKPTGLLGKEREEYDRKFREIVSKIIASDPDKAEKLTQLLNATTKEAAETWHELAHQAVQDKRYKDAEILMQKTLLFDAENGACYSNLATIQRHLGEAHKSLQSAKKAVKLLPNNADAYFNLALSLAETGNKTAAISSYQSALTLHPQHLYAWKNLGILLRDAGKEESAKQALGNAQVLAQKHLDE
ncbi:DUF2919 family protein [Solemya elarraichensis gill symbiont]|uniref:Uncharacterized protein n=1 Tax=Solemya elarraichensis gill symbiont TaxID=1918949 RepID=A0A1T2L0D7_9GAMM|nr:DUF2919 family protein [Solemya elarraichensis gill symbiont]OOZ38565.1 hypothetical protein BOW52_08320 [Solemya elarraichensis gill symbiont]